MSVIVNTNHFWLPSLGRSISRSRSRSRFPHWTSAKARCRPCWATQSLNGRRSFAVNLYPGMLFHTRSPLAACHRFRCTDKRSSSEHRLFAGASASRRGPSETRRDSRRALQKVFALGRILPSLGGINRNPTNAFRVKFGPAMITGDLPFTAISGKRKPNGEASRYPNRAGHSR
jgi:hypothetical protein